MIRRLAHAAGEERLADRVVDLVRARVEEILALQVHARKSRRLAESSRVEEWGGPPREITKLAVQLLAKRRIAPCLIVSRGQVEHGRKERLGNVGAAELAEATGPCFLGWRAHGAHDRLGRSLSAARMRSMKARTFSGLFLPHLDSSLLEASTPKGRTSRIRGGHVLGVETARHDEPPAMLDAQLGPGPVGDQPGSTGHRVRVGVEEVRVKRHHGKLRRIGQNGPAKHVPHLQVRWGFEFHPARHLNGAEVELPRDRHDHLRPLGREHADHVSVGRDVASNLPRAIERDAARALGEHESDRIGARIESHPCVGHARNPTDLDPGSHAFGFPPGGAPTPSNSRRASAGLSARRSASPTSTASAPTRSNASISARVR